MSVGRVDFSIFAKAHKSYLKSLKKPKYNPKISFSPGPFKYQDFNKRSRKLIAYAVDKINRKYGKNYNPKLAFDIQDDGTPDYISIGLWDSILEQKSYYLILTRENDVRAVDSCCAEDDFMTNREVKAFIEETLGRNHSIDDERELMLELAAMGKIPPPPEKEEEPESPPDSFSNYSYGDPAAFNRFLQIILYYKL